MGLLDKANKRSCYPVPLPDRTAYVRAMTFEELARMNAIDKSQSTFFVLGNCLTLEDGTPEFTKSEGEEDAAFSTRVMQELSRACVDIPTCKKLIDAVGKVTEYDPESIAKN